MRKVRRSYERGYRRTWWAICGSWPRTVPGGLPIHGMRTRPRIHVAAMIEFERGHRSGFRRCPGRRIDSTEIRLVIPEQTQQSIEPQCATLIASETEYFRCAAEVSCDRSGSVGTTRIQCIERKRQEMQRDASSRRVLAAERKSEREEQRKHEELARATAEKTIEKAGQAIGAKAHKPDNRRTEMKSPTTL